MPVAPAERCPQLMPLLLRSLDLPDHEIRVNVIDTLVAIADTTSKDNNPIVQHAPSLVTTMLHNSLVKAMPSPVSLAPSGRRITDTTPCSAYEPRHCAISPCFPASSGTTSYIHRRPLFCVPSPQRWTTPRRRCGAKQSRQGEIYVFHSHTTMHC